LEFMVVNLLNGISFGMVLFLIGSGLSLTLGLMGIANLAHGALFMFGGYVGWSVAVQFGLNYWLSVLAGGIAAGLVGLAVQRGALHFLYKLLFEQVVLTVGVLFVISNVVLWVWGGQTRTPFTAPLLSSSFSIFSSEYPLHRIATIGIGLIMAFFLWWFQERTRVGAIIRAGMDDKETTTGLGINSGLVDSLVFFFGAFIAGAAGVLGAQLMGLNINMGLPILLFALMVVIVGGMGSIQGAFVGAVVIGLIDAFSRALVPGIGMFTMWFIMIVVLLVRPSGILPR